MTDNRVLRLRGYCGLRGDDGTRTHDRCLQTMVWTAQERPHPSRSGDFGAVHDPTQPRCYRARRSTPSAADNGLQGTSHLVG